MGQSPHRLGDVEALEAKIQEIRDARDNLHGDSAALEAVRAKYHSQESELLKQLRDVRALRAQTGGDPLDEMTDEEILGQLCDAVQQFPDEAVSLLEAAIEQRRTGRLRRVV